MLNERTALNGTTATTNDHDWKEKKGSTYTPLIVVTTALLLGLLAFYAGQRRGSSTVAGGVGGTTRDATASLTLYSDDDDFDGHTRFKGCEESIGSYVSGTDYCFACGEKADGTLGHCWNNKECPPACGDARGVSGRMDGECGTACRTFKFSPSWLKQSTIEDSSLLVQQQGAEALRTVASSIKDRVV